jgi:hypothetical protein
MMRIGRNICRPLLHKGFSSTTGGDTNAAPSLDSLLPLFILLLKELGNVQSTLNYHKLAIISGFTAIIGGFAYLEAKMESREAKAESREARLEAKMESRGATLEAKMESLEARLEAKMEAIMKEIHNSRSWFR